MMGTQRLELGEKISWVTADGERNEMKDPDGPPTERQLMKLWEEGMLAVVAPDAANEFCRSQAAWALSWAFGEEAA